MRLARKGTLATLDHRHPGHPYASLVLIATEPDGTPVTLISGLALHTRNLAQDARASLLIEDAGNVGDPLSGGRLTLRGHLRPSVSGTALRRFLARHPSAEAYAALPTSRRSISRLPAAYIGGTPHRRSGRGGARDRIAEAAEFGTP
jgi:putative heme iron utilization protein